MHRFFDLSLAATIFGLTLLPEIDSELVVAVVVTVSVAAVSPMEPWRLARLNSRPTRPLRMSLLAHRHHRNPMLESISGSVGMCTASSETRSKCRALRSPERKSYWPPMTTFIKSRQRLEMRRKPRLPVSNSMLQPSTSNKPWRSCRSFKRAM